MRSIESVFEHVMMETLNAGMVFVC